MVQWLQPLISVAVLVISFFSSHPNQSPQALISNATIDYIESIRLKYDVPGISIGIIASPTHTGHDWQNETHGFGHMNDQGRAVDGDTLFVIASNSKLFAAVSIGLLIDNQTMLENGEKLDYCTKIKSILPNWHMEYPYLADHLDVLDLLSMRSGMPAHDGAYAKEDSSKIAARLARLRALTEIREIMQYNNMHYWIIGEIVAHITNVTYPEFVKTNILDPIGMTSSTYNHTKAQDSGHAAMPFARADQNITRCKEVWAEEDRLDRSCVGRPFETPWIAADDGLYMAAAAGLVSSANDMIKWVKELLQPAVIPVDVLAETHKSFIPAFTEIVWYDEVGIEGYGQGQTTFNYRGHHVVHHLGNIPGFGSQVIRLPDLGFGFFIGFNDNQIGHLIREVVVYRILDSILGLEPIDWEERSITSQIRKKPLPTMVIAERRPAPLTESLTWKYFDKGSSEPNSAAYLQAIRRTMTTSDGISEPLMIVQMDKMFGSVYVYSHFDGPIFNTTALYVQQDPQGEWVATGAGGSTAVFVEGEGMGMSENFWVGRHWKRAVKVRVEEEAEAWFNKTSRVAQILV